MSEKVSLDGYRVLRLREVSRTSFFSFVTRKLGYKSGSVSGIFNLFIGACERHYFVVRDGRVRAWLIYSRTCKHSHTLYSVWYDDVAAMVVGLAFLANRFSVRILDDIMVIENKRIVPAERFKAFLRAVSQEPSNYFWRLERVGGSLVLASGDFS